MRTASGLALLSLVLLGADTPSATDPAGARPAPSFVNDVVPVLTRLGCNSGSCHGKLAGQNGFKLSLRGYAPEMDHIGDHPRGPGPSDRQEPARARACC